MSLRSSALWLCTVLLLCLPVAVFGQAYTQIVIFGDSLSDTGNVAHLTQAKYGTALRIPGVAGDYTDGRFTDGGDTVPAAHTYFGVWIEQLAATLPAKPAIKNSLDGGTNYAYGFALTGSGTSNFTFGPNNIYSVQIENMGQQVSDYLATNPTITNKTLFVVWGGANDLLNATSSADVTNAATQEIGVVQRLIAAGATDIIVPNLPPLGLVPRLNGSVTASASATQAAAGFNQALAAGLASLPAANPGKALHIFPMDVFSLFNSVVGPPIATGYTNVTASSQLNALVNPDTYLFWDDLHPTTTGHHTLAVTAGVLVAPAIATITTVASSVQNANLNSPVTFTATVSSSSGVPPGSVTFFDGTSSLGTGTLSSSGTNTATATLTTSTLTAGTHTIMASYPGSSATLTTAAYASSASPTITETVTAPSFSSALSPASLTITRGLTGKTTVTVTPVGGYSGNVSFACGTLPANISCSFSPVAVNLGGNNVAQTTTLTIGTQIFAGLRRPALPGRASGSGIFSAVLLLPCFGLGGFLLFGKSRRRHGRLGLLVLLCFVSSGVVLGTTGCVGPDILASSGTYTVPVNVTANGSTTTLKLTVVVQ